MSDVIRAPFTESQIAALNASQRSGRMHPFTCGGEHELHQTLIAERDGWRCPDDTCDFRQDWAPSFMVIPGALVDRLADVWPYGRTRVEPASDAVLAELAKVRRILHVTEDELARERQRSAELSRRLVEEEKAVGAERARTEALRIELRMLQSVRGNAPAEPPDGSSVGDCEPAWPRQSASTTTEFTDVPTRGML